MIKDKKFVERSSNFEKVLGYHYNINLDYLKISNDFVDKTVKTNEVYYLNCLIFLILYLLLCL